jgi:hypothetical protein
MAVPPEFDLRRREWVILNRFRTSQGKCAHLMHRWGYSDSAVCDCGFLEQTTEHILICPLRAFESDLMTLHKATPEAVNYLRTLDLDL